jgi:hypothetical protein
MYDQLVQIIAQIYPSSQAKGLFLTCMNGGAVISSVWVCVTDRPRTEALAKLYKSSSQSSTPITTIICDIIIDTQEVTDYASLATMNHEEVWLALISSDGIQIGVLLPHTAGIQNLSQWLAFMKQKYQLQGMVWVYTIKTDRKIITSATK